MGAGIPDLSSRRIYGGGGLERIEGGAPSMEQIIGSIPNAAPYKWNDRDLLVSPLAFRSQNFGPDNFAAGANGPIAHNMPLTTGTPFSRRGGIWIIAASVQFIAADNSLKLQIVQGGLFVNIANDDNSNPVSASFPVLPMVSGPGTFIAQTVFPIPFQPMPMPLVLSDPFQPIPVPSAGATARYIAQLNFAATILNTDGAAAHNITTVTVQCWWRTVEGLEP